MQVFSGSGEIEDSSLRRADSPLVTIITVVFNGEQYLDQTIKSVIQQSYDNIEYLVIDGGSTDHTLKIIHTYERFLDYWISEPDHGIYDAMNKGISLASGEIIGILNSDDLYFPYTVAEVVKWYTQFGKPCVLYGDMLKFAGKDTETVSYHKGNLTDTAFKTLKMTLNHPTCFVHRDLYQRYGAFHSKYRIGADRDLMIRFYRQGVPFIYIEKLLAKFRLGGATSSHTLKTIVSTLTQKYAYLSCNGIPRRQIYPIIGLQALRMIRGVVLAKILGPTFTNKLKVVWLQQRSRNR
jgi:glycosyltransferase involved in cell wall biosynthesis